MTGTNYYVMNYYERYGSTHFQWYCGLRPSKLMTVILSKSDVALEYVRLTLTRGNLLPRKDP